MNRIRHLVDKMANTKIRQYQKYNEIKENKKKEDVPTGFKMPVVHDKKERDEKCTCARD